MFNPLEWFRNKPKIDTDALANIMANSYAMNAGQMYTWNDLFGNLHPRELRSDRGQLKLAAIFCALNTYIGATLSLPRFTQRIDSATQTPQSFVKTTEHPAARIWSHYANDELSSDEMMKLMTFDVLLNGNFYALRERDSLGRVYRLHYIHPSRIPRGNIERATGKEDLLTGRKATPGKLIYKVVATDEDSSGTQEGFIVEQDDMTHIKGMIPDPEYHRSQGILECNARSAGLYDASEEMGSKFYTRGYTNQMFLTTDHKLTPKVTQEVEEALNRATGGSGDLTDMFKTKILTHNLKPVHVGIPLQQMQFIETRAFSVEDVARWFNMPAFILHSVMGTGQAPEDSDKLMVMWIQNGLGQFLSNIASQFRDQVLPRPSQPLFRFEFQRLHLYKTILNDFSQALRNLFEIGAINRMDVASLMGIHLDPTDITNTQRYVPANLVTVNHSLALEQKAKVSIEQMQQAMEQTAQQISHAQENHTLMKEQMEFDSSDDPDESEEVDPEADEKDDKGSASVDPKRDQDDDNQDKKTRAVPARNIIRKAFLNVLNGLHDYELRVAKQKLKSRPDNYQEAMQEWAPKFADLLTNTLSDWEEIIPESDRLAANWMARTMDSLDSGTPVEELMSNFQDLIKPFKGEDNEIDSES